MKLVFLFDNGEKQTLSRPDLGEAGLDGLCGALSNKACVSFREKNSGKAMVVDFGKVCSIQVKS